MGCPDTVAVPCPTCGTEAGFQSKGGPELCWDYTLQDAPDDVLSNVNRHAPYQCADCGTWFYCDAEKREAVIWPHDERPSGINGFYYWKAT